MSRRARAVIVGPGRVGRTVALLLRKLGYKVEAGFSRKDSIPRDFIPPDLLLITTPDDVIAMAAADLAARPLEWRRTVALHCSGAFGSELLGPLAERGASTGSLHPLKSFTRPANSVGELKGIHWCVEGDARAERMARRIVRAAGGHIVRIDASKKPVYHAAAVMACGHLAALIDLSIEMLGESGIGRDRALEMLLPLIEGTVRNLAAGTEAALTGPFARRDYKTINIHLEALMGLKSDYVTIYSLLGHHSLQMGDRNSKNK